MLALAHQMSQEQGHMPLHFMMFTGIMGWQGGQQRERLSCNYRVARFDPHNKQNDAFIYTFLNWNLYYHFVQYKSWHQIPEIC